MRYDNNIHPSNHSLQSQIYLFWRKSFFFKKGTLTNSSRLSFSSKRTLLLSYQTLFTLQAWNNTTSLVNISQQTRILLTGDGWLRSISWKTWTCYKILLSNYSYFQFVLCFKTLLFLTAFDENGFFFNFSKLRRTLPYKVISFSHTRYL